MPLWVRPIFNNREACNTPPLSFSKCLSSLLGLCLWCLRGSGLLPPGVRKIRGDGGKRNKEVLPGPLREDAVKMQWEGTSPKPFHPGLPSSVPSSVFAHLWNVWGECEGVCVTVCEILDCGCVWSCVWVVVCVWDCVRVKLCAYVRLYVSCVCTCVWRW